MNIPLEYHAGILDGEGTFAITLHYKNNYVNLFRINTAVQIVMGHSEEVFDDLKKKFGGYTHKSKVPTWRVNTRDECRYFAETLLPHLHVKKDECKTFLKILDYLDGGLQFSREGILKIAKERYGLTKNTHRMKYPLELVEKLFNENPETESRKIRISTSVKWSFEEDNFLRENHLLYNDKELSKKIITLTGRNRSNYAIKKRRLKMGFRKKEPYPRWTPKEVDFLVESYREKTDLEISNKINRSNGAVCDKRMTLGLRKR